MTCFLSTRPEICHLDLDYTYFQDELKYGTIIIPNVCRETVVTPLEQHQKYLESEMDSAQMQAS